MYHNPGCSKSRGALEILADQGVDHDVVEYLRPRPTGRASSASSTRFPTTRPRSSSARTSGSRSWDCRRRDYTTRDAVIELLLEHPELMQRPVVFRGERAVIARPSEKVLELLD